MIIENNQNASTSIVKHSIVLRNCSRLATLLPLGQQLMKFDDDTFIGIRGDVRYFRKYETF